MLPEKKLDIMVVRHASLEAELSRPVGADAYVRLTRELAEIAPVVEKVKAYRSAAADLAELDALIADTDTDPELRTVAAEEKPVVEARCAALEHDIQLALIPKDAMDEKNVILEIRAGTGGDEAALFAGDLYEMYTHYARDQGWKVEDISFSPGEQGGFKEIVFSLTGDSVFADLRYESGGHRVQRVPKTEQQGRIHTSAATVAVMPEPDTVEVEIREQDLEWERMRAGGAGGQHVNKTESAVRIRHIPTGLEVKCQDQRSQHKNYERAMRILRSRLYEMQQQKLHRERSEQRRTLIGSGDRSERIRTYNFPQNRVTDHRVNLNLYKLDSIIAGNLGEVVHALKDFDKKQRLGESGGQSA
jgi:peptide chain release factor 1